jgi:hypothetical protein
MLHRNEKSEYIQVKKYFCSILSFKKNKIEAEHLTVRFSNKKLLNLLAESGTNSLIHSSTPLTVTVRLSGVEA